MTSIIPDNSRPYEKAIEASHSERWSRLNDAVPSITTAKDNPPPSFLPFLVWEFGLGVLTPYVDNLYNFIQDGIRWQRVRGTFAAVRRGLAFLGLTAAVEPAWHGRTWWNSSQLRFNQLPSNDAPLLERVEGITKLSLPLRSDLRRGVIEYDIPPVEVDGTLLDGSLLDEESGIRMPNGSAIWSFGRTAELDVLLSEAEGIEIGNWIDIPAEGGIPWASMNYPWATASFPWAANAESQRRSLLAGWFTGRRMYAVFRDEDDQVIGYRRVRVARAMSPQFQGLYSFAGQAYAAVNGGQVAYIEAMTDFADADGVVARSVALATSLTMEAGVPPGKLWLTPEDVATTTEFAKRNVTLPLRRTVRERVKFLVRF